MAVDKRSMERMQCVAELAMHSVRVNEPGGWFLTRNKKPAHGCAGSSITQQQAVYVLLVRPLLRHRWRYVGKHFRRLFLQFRQRTFKRNPKHLIHRFHKVQLHHLA